MTVSRARYLPVRCELRPYDRSHLRVLAFRATLVADSPLIPKGCSRPRPGPVTVRFGDPIVPSPSDGRLETAARLERAVADLMDRGA